MALQGMIILVDELYFHRNRPLPLWERIGHPLDTFLFLVCVSVPWFVSLTGAHLALYAFFSAVSCLMITKDEAVHTHCCGAWEHWLHSLLFIAHPVLLIEVFVLWVLRTPYFYEALQREFQRSNHQAWIPLPYAVNGMLLFQMIGTFLFLCLQVFGQTFKTAQKGAYSNADRD